jgi:hypothetical protein
MEDGHQSDLASRDVTCVQQPTTGQDKDCGEQRNAVIDYGEQVSKLGAAVASSVWAGCSAGVVVQLSGMPLYI